MPIVIEDDRVQQVENTVRKFVGCFTPITATTTEEFLSTLESNVEWYDHGFFIVRKGHQAILKLREGFLHCNDPFESEIKDLQITQQGAATQTVWKGCCKNGIVRPDGSVIMKASGKNFKTQVAFFLRVTEQGKISRIDEYDHRYWDEGKPEAEYAILT